MARIFKPRNPVMRIVRDAAGHIVMDRKQATRGPRRGQWIETPRREPMATDGKPFHNADGRRRPGAKRAYMESKYWAIEYRDASGRRRVVKGSEYEQATHEMAAAMEMGVTRQRAGITAADPRHAQRSIDEHIVAWVADMERSKRSPEYIRKVRTRVERAKAELGWGRLSQVDADGVTAWLTKLAAGGAGDRTINHYHAALLRFCTWCVSRQRLDANPLRHVSKITAPQPVTQRRAITVEELDRLVSVHPRRGLVYLTAALTGLRKSELRALAWGDLKIDAPRPFIELRAETTKARRADTIAVNDELAARLRGARPANWAASDRVFRGIPKFRVFHRDLADAGINRIVDGRVFDFHSLRVTHATLLATSGVSVREAMEQMRHTDIRLTTRTYTDPRLIDLHRAVNSLPKVAGSSSEREQQKATGTDGAPAKHMFKHARVSEPTRTNMRKTRVDGERPHPQNLSKIIEKAEKNSKKRNRRGGDSNPRTLPDASLETTAGKGLTSVKKSDDSNICRNMTASAIDPRLGRVNAAWGRLPETLRVAIDAMIGACGAGDD